MLPRKLLITRGTYHVVIQMSNVMYRSAIQKSVPLHQRVDVHVRERTFTEWLGAAVAQERFRNAAREGERGTPETRARTQPSHAETLELRRIRQSRPGKHIERQG